MPNVVLIGAQWGDEGKGKVIDVLTEKVDWVVRYQGGNNAGHTVEIGDSRYILHLIPSGILHPGKKCAIGNGVVIDPISLIKELDELKERDIDPAGRLFISDRAHVVLPFHRLLDAAREKESTGRNEQIGTTKRGIGPSYGDKAARVGLRMGDLVDPEFPALLSKRIGEQNKILAAVDSPLQNEAEVVEQYVAAAQKLAPYIADTVCMLNKAVSRRESVLFEGAQGTMLDIDFGTYPFVTSSNATSGGACTGSGIAPHRIDEVVGVIKAYTTRVGEGPFPTELTDDMGRQLREVGHEFGATTGRPRRCGWFDAVVARYSAMINGIDSWAVTKLDVLDNLKTIRICTAYECNGRTYDSVPAGVRVLEKCKPVYEEMEGWRESTREVASFDQLPAKAQAYLRRLEELTGVRIGMLSVGPRRASTMILEKGAGGITST